ncbi:MULTISPECIES: RagB/SusD family nutrient uptake outer membrane protein [Reichenbachiella]|uniref:Starch-binding associating with outer membrane n=1 Tax=Reichenbachiella agariperforans TaxID=156994 RepID=A0A1M6VUJ5_REIAG|nr:MULTISPECIES: RagB/SusD family nutrient uptake outer membrane protein [Reichenbachiella]RJE70969.1 carbohydrate-binding protein SusD [Reichenbachiella sp. MSK19-1]SHK85117.1 Starch-binding associating with outer membrane [Reichenbachiella agariperforans]
MKKHIIAYILTALVVLGCSEDFSEGTNKGALSDAALANADGVDLLLTAAYSALDGQVGVVGDWEPTGDNWWMDALTDDSHKGSTNGDQPLLHALQTYDWTTGNSFINSKWVALYAGANRANAVIALANTIEDVDLTTKIAEARFLRGHYYFELTRLYGDVAYVDEITAIENPDVPNEGPVWAEVEADFQFAIDNLPPDNGAGRASSWTAKAYMGKALLYQEKWAAAETMLDDVIDNGPYALNAEFNDNFNAAGKNSAEAIFSIQFEANDGATNNANGNKGGTLNFPGSGPLGTCCGFYQPTQDLANAFKTTAGLPEIDTYNDTDINNDYGLTSEDPFTPYPGDLDPRLDYTIGRRGIQYNGYGIHAGFDWVRAQADAGPYLPKKNVYKSGETSTMGTGDWGQQFSGIHYNVIRYADVLLMAAEAKAEQGDAAGAMALVNEVRNRAKTSTTVKAEDGTTDAAAYSIEPYTLLTFTDPVEMVRFERRLELSMEGHRMFDLRRWSQNDPSYAVDIINEFVANEKRTVTTFSANTYTEKHNIFPVPLRALDISENLTQNDAWSGQ